MKKISSFYLLVIFLMVPLLYACPGKDPKPKTKTELIQKNWKVRQVTSNGTIIYTDPPVSTPNTQDFSAYRLNFTSGSNFSRTEVGNTSTTTGTWQFDNNDNPKKITFSLGNPASVTVESLTEKNLVISYIIESTKTGPVEYEITLIPAQ
jgi:hypothetical protein